MRTHGSLSGPRRPRPNRSSSWQELRSATAALLSMALLSGHAAQGASMSDGKVKARVVVDDGGLLASAPLSAMAEQLHLYGQFIGDWDLLVTQYLPDGTTTSRRGEWNFRWVLEGRAVQDMFIVPARGDRGRAPPDKKESYGTTLRIYDPERDSWEITYVDPVYAAVFRMTARVENGEIVQKGVDRNGHTYRWVFFDIHPDSFRWRSEVMQDGGTTWRKEQDFRATRKTQQSAARG